MRTLAVFALILTLPIASAGHATTRELGAEVEAGATIVLALDASGSVRAHGSGSRGESRTTLEYEHRYAWGGLLELQRGADGVFWGERELRGGGQGQLVMSHTSPGGGFTTTCDADRRLLDVGRSGARAHLTPETGELLVVITSMGDVLPQDGCVTQYSSGHQETSPMWPPPPLSPLVVEGMRSVGDARVQQVSRGLDELNAANAVIFRVRLQDGHTILRGGASAPYPKSGEGPMEHLCPNADISSGSCSVSGTLHVRTIVNPCNALRASLAVHLAAVQALQQPPSGSSESQVRAFSVDARQKVQALLADARGLELICGEEAPLSLEAVLGAQEKVLSAWIDVAKKHGLSDDGKRELVGAERGRQLVGGGDGSAAVAEAVGTVLASEGNYGPIVVRAHSPVALHAWDEEGRHVGWNESAGAPDAQVRGASYHGRPGEGQELTLPSGFYKLAAVELGEGEYLLGTSWNGSGGEEGELLPLASRPGRALVQNILVDAHGMLAGPTQRVASVSAAFVEPWAPLPFEPSPALAGGTPGASVEGREEGAPAKDEGVPGAPLAALVALVALVALARRRG